MKNSLGCPATGSQSKSFEKQNGHVTPRLGECPSAIMADYRRLPNLPCFAYLRTPRPALSRTSTAQWRRSVLLGGNRARVRCDFPRLAGDAVLIRERSDETAVALRSLASQQNGAEFRHVPRAHRVVPHTSQGVSELRPIAARSGYMPRDGASALKETCAVGAHRMLTRCAAGILRVWTNLNHRASVARHAKACPPATPCETTR